MCHCVGRWKGKEHFKFQTHLGVISEPPETFFISAGTPKATSKPPEQKRAPHVLGKGMLKSSNLPSEFINNKFVKLDGGLDDSCWLSVSGDFLSS